jgi:bacteriocin-like protein
MKVLSDQEMMSINGGLPQAYYMDNDVISSNWKLLKRGFSLFMELLTLPKE